MLRLVLCLLSLVPAQFTLNSGAFGQAALSLYLDAGKPGTESFELGVGISSLVKVKLLPSDGIDLTLTGAANDDINGDLLIIDQDELAALDGLEPVTPDEHAQLRTIMVFNRHDAGTGPALELVARADVPDLAVYFITKAILENGVFFEGLNQRSFALSADKALVGITLPLHPGAVRYFEEIGEANLSAHMAGEKEPTRSDEQPSEANESTFYLDFGGETTALDQRARRQIAEACQYATIFDAAKIEVAGFASSSRQNSSLARERERYVMEALRANAGCSSNVDIVLADRSVGATETVPSTDDQGRVEVIIKFAN